MLNINSRLDGKLQWNVFASLYTAKKNTACLFLLLGAEDHTVLEGIGYS
jgi:hypothetical protein